MCLLFDSTMSRVLCLGGCGDDALMVLLLVPEVETMYLVNDLFEGDENNNRKREYFNEIKEDIKTTLINGNNEISS